MVHVAAGGAVRIDDCRHFFDLGRRAPCGSRAAISYALGFHSATGRIALNATRPFASRTFRKSARKNFAQLASATGSPTGTTSSLAQAQAKTCGARGRRRGRGRVAAELPVARHEHDAPWHLNELVPRYPEQGLKHAGRASAERRMRRLAHSIALLCKSRENPRVVRTRYGRARDPPYRLRTRGRRYRLVHGTDTHDAGRTGSPTAP